MASRDKYPPLITARSPSFSRARAEKHLPPVAADAGVIANLSRLVEIEDNASRAARQGAGMVRDEPLAEGLQQTAAIHDARREALGELVTGLGGSPPSGDEIRELLDHNEGTVRRSVDDDMVDESIVGNHVLDELRAMEEEIARRYSEAASDRHIDADVAAYLRSLSE